MAGAVVLPGVLKLKLVSSNSAGNSLRRYMVDAISFARERLGFHPDPDQALILDPSIRRGIVNCCRQWGKSTTVAVRAVWKAFHYPNSLTVVASPSARQSGEFVRKAESYLHELGIRPRGDGDNRISLLFPNGSRIVGLPGNADTTRGFSNVDLLLVDEASRVPDDLYYALRPMIAANPNAAIWLMSTPNGRQGFFYEEWISGDPHWTRIEAPATRCPRITAEYLDEERRKLTEEKFRTEYLCEFLSADSSYFNHDAIEAAFTKLGHDREGAVSRFYLGLDLGQAREYSAIAIAERRIEPTGEIDHVTYERLKRTRILITHLERIPLKTPYPEVINRVSSHVQRFQNRQLDIIVDATGVGAAVREMLAQARLRAGLYGVTITPGERVTHVPGVGYHVPRHDLLANLRVLLEKGMLEIQVEGDIADKLRDELHRFGLRSSHDDLIFAIALACWKAGGQPLPLNGTGPLPFIHPEVRP